MQFILKAYKILIKTDKDSSKGGKHKEIYL